MSPVRRGLIVVAVAALALATVAAWLAYGQPVVAGALVVLAAFAIFGATRDDNGGE